ncbi:protein SUPPRESSOR OF GENE SILENCING 3 [Gastrolobium bilobum]|uniref:protein SUPPRESSOR OF GENE SILENCING 3 n=1 Tax=Gastrolobium bilobum TaxID=150636 RepID=UPI002AAF37B9|nr:protein SUPPRESSOR OF GENE SILENCING 3 [Gastrolobium bilobum]XP_061376110.1 protein SUPPRESSOR OF GENE SILENCING 3 [Gastrolobium bilobum]
MSSKRGVGRPSAMINNDDLSSKGKSISDSHPEFEQLTQGIADVNLDSGGQDDGEWEVYARKPKNRAGSSAPKQWGPPAHNSNPRAWGNTDMAQRTGIRNQGGVGRASGNAWQTQNANLRRPAGRGNGRPQLATSGYESNNMTPNPVIRPPLEHGWNWQSRTGSMQSNAKDETAPEYLENNNDVDDIDDDDKEESDGLEDTDDDLMSDEYDSDASQKSHETRKKSKWFKKFFEILDSLTVEEINEPERQWHCAACQGGPGAIDWYRGLQPLMTHAKTKGSNRVKIHRELAELLDEELRRRGTSVIPSGEAFGKWKGLKDEEKDHEIVWPPIVVIQNTKLEQDENEKWKGMGNQELLDYFSSYAAMKARHSYGPQGHRGMSVLIFEASASGYLEAERLHKHFAEQGTDKDAWYNRRILFLPGGNRQLYGYMATKEDLDLFNKHSQGKSRLKYEMRSYQEMVVNQIRQMNEDNQKLIYLKNKVVNEKRRSKALEESFGIVTEKLRKTTEENRIVRRRTKMQHEENKEEMYMQEQFFKDQIRIIHDSRNAKEEDFERVQQTERKKAEQSSTSPLNAEERRLKMDEYLKFVEVQDKEMENFVAEKEKLYHAHEESIAAMRLRHWEEEVQMEKMFDEELTKLMEKYSPSDPETKSNGI